MNRRLSFFSLCCSLANAFAADSMKLTLPEAVRLALAQNHSAENCPAEGRRKRAEEGGGQSRTTFPRSRIESTFAASPRRRRTSRFPQALSALPNAGLVPNTTSCINQGSRHLITSGTMATQPLTPLIRIRQANRIAASEVAASRDELKKAENEVALKVHEVYYGILIAGLQKQAAEQDSAYSETRLSESEEDVATETHSTSK